MQTRIFSQILRLLENYLWLWVLFHNVGSNMSSFTVFIDLFHESYKNSSRVWHSVRRVGKCYIRMVQHMKITWVLEVSSHIMVKSFCTSTYLSWLFKKYLFSTFHVSCPKPCSLKTLVLVLTHFFKSWLWKY